MKINFQPNLYYDSSVLGAAIGGASSILGDVFDLFGQSKANRDQEQYNRDIMNQQRQWALQDVATQNAYNSPVQQMQRLSEAGLNPNLLYGEGINAAGNSDQPRNVQSMGYQPENSLQGFSNIGSQTEGALALGNQLATGASSRNNTNADTINKQKHAVLQDIQNIEEKANGKADSTMSKWYQELDQDIAGYDRQTKGNKARASEMEPLRASLDFNLIQDQNKRDWAENTRKQALQQPTLELAIQSVRNAVEQNAAIKQSNQNAAAEFQNIMESTHLKQIEAMQKSGEMGQDQIKQVTKDIIEMLILSKALKGGKQSAPSPSSNWQPGNNNYKY